MYSRHARYTTSPTNGDNLTVGGPTFTSCYLLVFILHRFNSKWLSETETHVHPLSRHATLSSERPFGYESHTYSTELPRKFTDGTRRPISAAVRGLRATIYSTSNAATSLNFVRARSKVPKPALLAVTLVLS